MKKTFFLLPLSILTIVSQSYIFSGKTFSFNDEIDNPYIVYQSFDIIEEEITQYSFEFSIEVVDNSTNDFYNSLVKTPSIMTKYSAIDESVVYGENSYWINQGPQPSDGIYYFQLENGYFISPNRTYEILSLDHTGLAVGDSSNSIDDEITIIDDLGISDNTFTTSAVENPYIVTKGFEITKTTTNSVEFQITVMNDVENSFIPENDLNVTLKDNESVNHQTTASYVGTTEENKYTYKITELENGVPLIPNTHYQIYSLNSTGLAVQKNTAMLDEKIIITDDIGATDDNFTTSDSSPYIQEGGFEITNVTANSAEFQIKIVNNTENDNFIASNAMNVTLKDSQGNSHQTTASYVGVVDNTYTYQITELESNVFLEENTTYQIYSLNNTGLAVNNALNSTDDEIVIANDLNVTDNSFTTLNDNPYIENGGFEITNVTANSVEFQITIIDDADSSFAPENDLNITLKNSLGYSYDTIAHYKEVQRNTYTYEITELEPGNPLSSNSTYEIYSLNNTGLAINNGSNDLDDEILLQDDLGVSDNVFKTLPSESEPNKLLLNSFTIILIVLIFVLIAIVFYIKILFNNKKKY